MEALLELKILINHFPGVKALSVVRRYEFILAEDGNLLVKMVQVNPHQ